MINGMDCSSTRDTPTVIAGSIVIDVIRQVVGKLSAHWYTYFSVSHRIRHFFIDFAISLQWGYKKTKHDNMFTHMTKKWSTRICFICIDEDPDGVGSAGQWNESVLVIGKKYVVGRSEFVVVS
jgi:hypothetical protein